MTLPRARNRDLLPARQLAAAIDRMITRADAPRIVFGGPITNRLYSSGPNIRAGLEINERVHYRWRIGEQPTVGIDVADKVLIKAGLCWWDVWNENTVRLPIVTVTTYAWRMRRVRSGRRCRYRATTAVQWYGDQGPDLVELQRIQELWEPAETPSGVAA